MGALIQGREVEDEYEHWWWWSQRPGVRAATAAENAHRDEARHGTARSKGLDAGRRTAAAPSRAAFLRIPRQDSKHSLARLDLQRCGRKHYPGSAAVACASIVWVCLR